MRSPVPAQAGIPESEYVSGGYYVARLSRRAEYTSPELIPDRILSASGCICDFFPDTWAIEWTSDTVEDRSRQAAAFGISAIDLPKVMAWTAEFFSKAFGWPSAFYFLDAAQEARARFLPDNSEIVIFGLGLHESNVEKFLKAAKPDLTKPGCAPMGETGVFQSASSGRKIAGGGYAVGFELLATCSGLLTCSWRCNGLEKDCAHRLGIAPNRYGFVESYRDALRCAEFVSRPETRAEPGLWLPWLVTVYSA
jgi:hypothetical protein